MKTLIAIIILALLTLGIGMIGTEKCAEAAPCPYGYVLCCCNTAGGLCCNCMTFCSGYYVTGCICQ